MLTLLSKFNIDILTFDVGKNLKARRVNLLIDPLVVLTDELMVHSRECGEQFYRFDRYMSKCGSSPRVRGTDFKYLLNPTL
jgi:hypothetical protein